MKIVIQRVKKAAVFVEEQEVSSIGSGALLFVCMEKNDEGVDLLRVAEKLKNLRIFEEPETGKMNQSLLQVEGEFLCVSQFTLSWNGHKGNRPSFDQSMTPEKAQLMFNRFCDLLEELVPVKRGVFGAKMDVELINDGPVTFSLNF